MKYILMFTFIFNTLTTLAFAGQRSYEDVKNIAINWSTLQQSKITFSIDESTIEESLQFNNLTNNNENKIYHIVKLQPTGWVIVSGDDSVKPILDYSLDTTIGSNTKPSKELVKKILNIKKQAKNTSNINSLSNEPEIFKENLMENELLGIKKVIPLITVYAGIDSAYIKTAFIGSKKVTKFEIYLNGKLKETLDAKYSERGLKKVFYAKTKLKNLTADTKYEIYSIAVFSKDKSEKSKTHKFKTKGDNGGKADKPRLFAYARTNVAYVTMYTSYDGAKATSYEIYNKAGKLLKTVDSKNKRYVRTKLTGLTPNTKYEIYAIAVNAKGKSGKSKIISFKTKVDNGGKPDKPHLYAYARINSAIVKMISPRGSAKVTSYEIYNKAGKKLKTVPAKYGRYAKTKLTKLTPNTKYEIYVIAVNAKGKSEKSKIISFKTKGDNGGKPDKPHLYAYARTNFAYLTMYTSYDGAKATSYEIYNKAGKKLKTVPAKYGRYAKTKLTKLTPNTKYEIYVIAVNAKGKSEKSKIISFKTKGDNGGKPGIPYVRVYTTKNSASIAMSSPSNTAKVSSFNIYNKAGKLLKTVDSKNKRYVRTKLTGLTPNTKYEIYAIAVNAKGQSEKSKIISFKTKK